MYTTDTYVSTNINIVEVT